MHEDRMLTPRVQISNGTEEDYKSRSRRFSIHKQSYRNIRPRSRLKCQLLSEGLSQPPLAPPPPKLPPPASTDDSEEEESELEEEDTNPLDADSLLLELLEELRSQESRVRSFASDSTASLTWRAAFKPTATRKSSSRDSAPPTVNAFRARPEYCLAMDAFSF